MKIVAKCAVQLGGHVYHKGEVCDFGGEVTQRIAANFTNADGTALEKAKGEGQGQGEKAKAKAKSEAEAKAEAEKEQVAQEEELVKKAVETMKKEGIIQALDAMGVAYSAKASAEKLARTLLVARGDIEEK